MTLRVPFRCIDVREAAGVLHRGNVLLIDVRDTAAFDRTHIAGARHVSIHNLSAIINGTARSKPILIYCYHGYASREFAKTFSDFGFTNVYSLDGGYEAWEKRQQISRIKPNELLRQWLTENGFPSDNVNVAIANGTTPLMKAGRLGHGDVVRMLIEGGAQLDTVNADHNNALWFACIGSHLDVIDMLIDAGIDIDNRNDNGATPLMYAASAGKAAIVERLLAHGADVTPETLDGFTAIDLAVTVECLTLLRRASRTERKAEADATQRVWAGSLEPAHSSE